MVCQVWRAVCSCPRSPGGIFGHCAVETDLTPASQTPRICASRGPDTKVKNVIFGLNMTFGHINSCGLRMFFLWSQHRAGEAQANNSICQSTAKAGKLVTWDKKQNWCIKSTIDNNWSCYSRVEPRMLNSYCLSSFNKALSNKISISSITAIHGQYPWKTLHSRFKSIPLHHNSQT